MEKTSGLIFVATGVGGTAAAAGSAGEAAAAAAVVEVAEPVRTATTLPLSFPSHIGDPDCPCVDWQLCAPMLEQAEVEEEHSSTPAKAASVPAMSKKGRPELGAQQLVHIAWLGFRLVG